jgi:hypothetical protein
MLTFLQAQAPKWHWFSLGARRCLSRPSGPAKSWPSSFQHGGGRTRNALLRLVRCLGERGFALLIQRWKTLQHVTASPGKIGLIARAALVLVLFKRRMIT